MTRFMALAVVALISFGAVVPATAQLENVGNITFPTSGSLEAQEHFLRGVAILHSFGWKQANEQFQKAQELDPDFAMAYWGESLCYNHPLIGEQDLETPRKVLQKLGHNQEERLDKAPTEREKGFLNAVNTLFFGEGDSSARRIAYMEEMRKLYEKYPRDHEVAAFYALSLLSAAGPMGDQSHRTQVMAGSIAMKVFDDNPDHPGAAHYIIHAFDDPVHAPLALPAAWKFAEIAPAVSHARHMPSHIFIQRGMWEEVSRSNQSAYDVAVDLWEPGDSVGAMVHALDWGQYGDLQRGDYEKAKMWIGKLEKIAEDSEGQTRAVDSVPLVKARYIVETEKWKVEPVTESSSDHELLATGMSAIELGQPEVAKKAEARLAELAEKAKGGDDSYYAFDERPTRIMHNEVAALVRLADGKKDEAVELLEEGVNLAESMRPPNGAPTPVKPVHELFGEVLLEIDRPERAAELFETSLRRMPNRSRSLLGLARAYTKMGDRESAMEQYRKLAEVWEGRDFPELREAQEFLSTTDAGNE